MSKPQKPDIYVSHDEHEELIGLALRALGRVSGAALLLQEMERATVAEAAPPNVVTMNSNVDFEYSGRRYRDFQLVYPQCADITEGRISVLTPVGAALIGVGEGATMTWVGPDRDAHSLTVLKVSATAQH
jgi:regulator of nucleoside diphosphate kinase